MEIHIFFSFLLDYTVKEMIWVTHRSLNQSLSSLVKLLVLTAVDLELILAMNESNSG